MKSLKDWMVIKYMNIAMILWALFIVFTGIWLFISDKVKKNISKIIQCVSWVCAILCLICLLIYSINDAKIEQFNYNKAALEWFDSNTRTDKDAYWVVQEKQRLNDWLAISNIIHSKMGIFTVYPEGIRDLTPILW